MPSVPSDTATLTSPYGAHVFISMSSLLMMDSNTTICHINELYYLLELDTLRGSKSTASHFGPL